MGNEQPAPLTVWQLIHPRFPEVTYQGISMPPGHEDHSEGRALDLGLHARSPLQRQLADALLTILIRNAGEIAWSYIIWNHFIWYNDARRSAPLHRPQPAHRSHPHLVVAE